MTNAWVGLFSGGKDSSWAVYQALEDGLNVSRLLTVHPSDDSYMYHVPETQLARLAAESIGIELVEVEPGDLEATDAVDSAACRSPPTVSTSRGSAARSTPRRSTSSGNSTTSTGSTCSARVGSSRPS